MSERRMQTVSAEHISEPQTGYLISFDRAAYVNELYFPKEEKVVRAMAESPEKALEVAKYHWSLLGSNFRLLSEDEARGLQIETDDGPGYSRGRRR